MRRNPNRDHPRELPEAVKERSQWSLRGRSCSLGAESLWLWFRTIQPIAGTTTSGEREENHQPARETHRKPSTP